MKKRFWQFWKKGSATNVEPKKTQLELVMTHLTRRGSITTWQAITEYNITRLSAIVYRLKNEQGLPIHSKLVSTTPRSGEPKRYTVYTLNRG